ncbi:MAG TPA: tetratricopeptide repeat protein [Patescibacteria group bacterium]|nr:tetratricopeptide repeat protein [Patescibacteria group bacterium]
MNRKQRRADKSAKGYSASPQVQAIFDEAVRLHQAGRLAEAGNLYRQILSVEPQHADSLHLLGLVAYAGGRADIAAELIAQAIQVNHKASVYHNNLGLALQQMGRLDDAVASYNRALALAPKDPETLNNLGVALQAQGKFDQALEKYAQALVQRPDYVSAHYNRGNCLRSAGDPVGAVAAYRQALAIQPDYPEALNNLATVLKDHGEYVEAAACCEKALTIKPGHVESMVNLGSIFKELKEPGRALEYYDRALTQRPGYIDALNNKGLALIDLSRFDEAIECFDQAIAAAPNRAEIYNNLAAAFDEKGEYKTSFEKYQQALALMPDCPESYYGLGNLARKQGRIDEAVDYYSRAIALRPGYAEAHWNMAFLLLLKGDLIPGWRESEWRWRRKNMKMHGFAGPAWDGGDLTGKTILLHCEQGLGDSIQFIRYAAFVKRKGGTVLLSCPPVLKKLFIGVSGIDEIFTDPKNLPKYDVQAPLLSLPGMVGTTLETIPSSKYYLKADEGRGDFWRQKLSNLIGLKVGIVWRGNPQHLNDRNRSMRPEQFAAFANLPGVAIVNLQKDARSDEIAALGVGKSFLNAGPELGDFSDTAALVSCLDLVISVDTSVCHLAGALGVPVWTLVAHEPDWRWLLGRADTPWYPSMRLYRQPAAGDWASVAAAVKADLQSLAKT